MPLFVYKPIWDAARQLFEKMQPVIPSDFTGMVGIRLHRTGNPLTLELLGEGFPEKPLYPMVTLQLENGEMIGDWDTLEADFDVPWPRESDFHRYRDDVMTFYHGEDALEECSEKILSEADPGEELLRAGLVDHTGEPSWA